MLALRLVDIIRNRAMKKNGSVLIERIISTIDTKCLEKVRNMKTIINASSQRKIKTYKLSNALKSHASRLFKDWDFKTTKPTN